MCTSFLRPLLINILKKDQVRSHLCSSSACTSSRFMNWSKSFRTFLYTARRKEARVTLLKGEGNDLVKRGCFQEALQKYSQCLTLKPEECALYTNRYYKSTATLLSHCRMIILALKVHVASVMAAVYTPAEPFAS